jgi:Type VI secretion system/phage-baseplate injector OB domain
MSGERHYGKYRATVLNNLDPQGQGRVQVQLADVYGLFPSTWAMPCFPFAGMGMAGVVALPPVGAAIWVEFEAGDPDYPIWCGGFYPDPMGFPLLANGLSPVTPNIHFQTTTGVSLTLSDNPAAQVMVTTPSGASILIGVAGITISNGQGASIAMAGPSVAINGVALVVT